MRVNKCLRGCLEMTEACLLLYFSVKIPKPSYCDVTKGSRIFQCEVWQALSELLFGRLSFLAHEAVVSGYTKQSFCISVGRLCHFMMTWRLVLVGTNAPMTARAMMSRLLTTVGECRRGSEWVCSILGKEKKREKIGHLKCQHVVFSAKGQSRLSERFPSSARST